MAFSAPLKIYLASCPVDMRKSYQTLGMLVEQDLKGNLWKGQWFVFYNKRRDRLKILYWDENGFCLWQKRLEKGVYKLPYSLSSTSTSLSPYQLHGLIRGLGWQEDLEKQTRYRLVS